MFFSGATRETAAESGATAPRSDGRGIGRRRFVTWVVGAPVLTVATAAVGSTLSEATASAAVPSPPSVEELYDTGDVLITACAPTMPLVTLEIGADGVARLSLPRLEMGQGIVTAVAMLIAEVLDLPLERVEVTLSDARPELLFNQLSAGSSSLRVFYGPVRRMAAVARAQLVAAAADRWGVDRAVVDLEAGVLRGPGQLVATLGELSAVAATFDIAVDEVSSKPPRDFTVVGTPRGRTDGLDAVTGRKTFTMDILAGVAKPAMLKRPPTIKGTVRAVRNSAEVQRMPGVLAVTTLPTGVAVVGETFEQVRAAVNALDVTWGPGPVDGDSNASVARALRGKVLPFAVPPLGAATVEAEFDWAPVSHAPLETECAVADVRADSAEIWGGLQAPIVVKQELALMLDLPQEKVQVHVVPAGGGFGRKAYFEGATEAALVSRAVGMPVRLMWHRTDDMRHGRVRPQNHHRVRATVLAGQVVAFEHRVAGVALDVAPGVGEILTDVVTSLPGDARLQVGMRAYSQALFAIMVSSPYHLGVQDKVLTELANGMPTAAYRSVHTPTTRVSEEIVIDEVAALLGRDPLALRKRCVKEERGRAVLDKAAQLGDWGRRMPRGFAQGIGYHTESRTLTAAVVEVDGRDPDRPQVTKVTLVVDIGLAVNPSGLEAQMQGCIAEAISLTLRAGLHLENGLPLEGSYSNYRWLRMKDYPKDVTVHIMPPNGGEPGGAGEVGITAPSAAIANAYGLATGRKPRSFPLVHPVDFEVFPPSTLPTPPMV